MLKSRLRMRLRTDGTDTNYDETVYYGYVLNVKIDLHKMSKPVMTIKIAFEGWPYAGINK